MKLYSLILLTLLCVVNAVKSQDSIRLTLSAPNTVVLDKPFQLHYTLNTEGKNFRVPTIKNFKGLYGPYESQSYSIQTINGVHYNIVTFTYTYTIKALKAGIFIIPSATVTVNNQKIKSNEVTVKVQTDSIIINNPPNDIHVQSANTNTDIKSNYDSNNTLEESLWLIGIVILILFIIFSSYLLSNPNSSNTIEQDKLDTTTTDNKVATKTNFFSIMFWVLTPSIIVHFFVMQMPNMLRFGFWGILGGIFIFSLIPTVLWILSKKYENKKATMNNLYLNMAGYFFVILSICISLFYLLGSFAALAMQNHY